MKLGLGTAQFGLNYGISNKNGQTLLDEAKCIVDLARQHEIKTIDTASLYGESEAVLGKILSPNDCFHIITKTPKFSHINNASDACALLKNSFQQSLGKLKQESVYGLLVHNADDLLRPFGGELYNEIVTLIEKGAIKKWGVSVYNAAQLEAVIQKYPVEIVQLPLNIFDQRLLVSGHLQQLKERGIEVHARSAFLQGLLLMNSDDVPPFFDPIFEHFFRYRQYLHELNWSAVDAALGFVSSIGMVDQVICGVNSKRQLLELLSVDYSKEYSRLSCFALFDNEFVDPREWRLNSNDSR